MRQVQVTLLSGYISRNMNLRVGKTSNGRRWEIQAYDGNGMFTTQVTVDGQTLGEFNTQREALEVLSTLPQGPFWATSDRRPSFYIQPANTESGTAMRQSA